MNDSSCETNKKKVVLIGGGGHAKSVLSVIAQLDCYQVIGYTELKEKVDMPIPYLGTDDELLKIRNKASHAVIGVGQVIINILREELYKKLKKLDYILPIIIDPSAHVASSAQLGEGTVVMKNCVVNVDATIGKCCIINTASVVEHDCQIGNFAHISLGAILGGQVRVGSRSIIGAGAVVIQNLSIVDEVIIGAGACVVKDCKKSGVYLGVPAVFRAKNGF